MSYRPFGAAFGVAGQESAYHYDVSKFIMWLESNQDAGILPTFVEDGVGFLRPEFEWITDDEDMSHNEKVLKLFGDKLAVEFPWLNDLIEITKGNLNLFHAVDGHYNICYAVGLSIYAFPLPFRDSELPKAFMDAAEWIIWQYD